MEIYHCQIGQSPLILSMPHSGTQLPEALTRRLTESALVLPDTDWHIPRLYAFADPLDPTVLRANFSRYVVDLNRPPDNTSLYPGQATTGLCPEVQFDGSPVYLDVSPLSDTEISQRRQHYWQPYHTRLQREIERIVGLHGHALVYDCHSIASRVPRLFEGELPVLNLGTANGDSCAPALQQRLETVLSDSPLSSAVNGRFVGGYITRHYGNPQQKVHSVQMEIGQDAYLSGDYSFAPEKASELQSVLSILLNTLIEWRPE